MTDSYSSNIERLRANANDIYKDKFTNADSAFRLKQAQIKEEVDTIKATGELLVGQDPQQQWTDAFQKRKATFRGGQGLIPGLAGERAGKQFKKGDEKREKRNAERVARLAEIAAHVDGLKEQDLEYHRQKINMLNNGAYYEDADRFTKLSPWAQVGYASHGIGLYNNTVADKLNNWFATSDEEINVGGTVFKPRSIHNDHAFPLILKEHALNIGIEELRAKHGINGYSEAMLDLFGVNNNPAMGSEGIGSETAAKNAMMAKFRTAHNIDASHKTRLKEMMDWVNSPDKNLTKLVTVFSGTIGFDGNRLHNVGGWNMAEDMIVDELVSGGLQNIEDYKSFIYDILGSQPSPIDPNKTIAETHGKRLDRIYNNTVAGKEGKVNAQLKDDEVKRKALELKFQAYMEGMKGKYGDNWKPGQEAFTGYLQKWQELGGGNNPPSWLSDAFTIMTQDDRQKINEFTEVLANGGTISPSDWNTVSPTVRNYFNKAIQTSDGGTTTRRQIAEGEGYLKSVLKNGGEYYKKLNILNNQILGESAAGSNNDSWGIKAIDARQAMEADFYERFLFHKNKGNVTDVQAAQLAFEDVRERAAVDVEGKESKYKGSTEFQASGRKWTGIPVKDSAYYNIPPLNREDAYNEGGRVVEGLDWYNKNIFPGGDAKLLMTKRIAGTNDIAEQGARFFKGETTVIPSYYQRLANKIPGLTDYQLMKYQVMAHYPEHGDPLLWQPKNVPHPSEVFNMPHFNDIARYLNTGTSTCSKMQAKACLVDKRNDANINPANFDTIQEVVDAHSSIGEQQVVESPDGPPKDRPIRDPILFEEGADVSEAIPGDIRTSNGVNEILVQVAEGETEWVSQEILDIYGDSETYAQSRSTYKKNIYDSGPGFIEVSDAAKANEAFLNRETTAEKGEFPPGITAKDLVLYSKNTGTGWLLVKDDKDVRKRVWQQYRNNQPVRQGFAIGPLTLGDDTKGKTETGAITIGGNLGTQLKRDLNLLNQESQLGTPTPNVGFGLTPPSMATNFQDTQFTSTFPITATDFEDLSIDQHKLINKRLNFQSAIPEVYGMGEEEWLEQFPIEVRTQIRNMERTGQWNPTTHNIELGPLKGKVFGIPWSIPSGHDIKLIPREKVSNLQSVMSSPDSPYLAENLREYASQLYATNVLTEIPANA